MNISRTQKMKIFESYKKRILKKQTKKTVAALMDLERNNNDSNDVEDSVVNVIIGVCYAYDTTPYIDSIEKLSLEGLSPKDRKTLDPVLSCLSFGTAIRFLKMRYGKGSENIIQKLYDCIYSSAISVSNSPDISPEDIANFYVELINNYSNVLDYEAVNVLDYGLGICEKVFEPVEDLFEKLKPTSKVALFIMPFMSEFGLKMKGIIERAEKKHNYSPSVK